MRAKYRQIISCVRREKTLLDRRERIDVELLVVRAKLDKLLERKPKGQRGDA